MGGWHEAAAARECAQKELQRCNGGFQPGACRYQQRLPTTPSGRRCPCMAWLQPTWTSKQRPRMLHHSWPPKGSQHATRSRTSHRQAAAGPSTAAAGPFNAAGHAADLHHTLLELVLLLQAAMWRQGRHERRRGRCRQQRPPRQQAAPPLPQAAHWRARRAHLLELSLLLGCKGGARHHCCPLGAHRRALLHQLLAPHGGREAPEGCPDAAGGRGTLAAGRSGRALAVAHRERHPPACCRHTSNAWGSQQRLVGRWQPCMLG